MTIVPCTVRRAKTLVRMWHRHLPGVHGGLFAAALEIDGAIVAAAIAGNPPPTWQGTGRIAITRVAVAPGVDVRVNACSRLYGALCGAARSLGYREAWTYTLPEEPGTSLRAAGFSDAGMTDGDGEWNRKARPRQLAIRPERKQRWVRKLAS